MVKPLNTEIASLQAVTLHYSPGVPVYDLKIINNNNTTRMVASVSYDRATGTLSLVLSEAGA